MHADKARRCFMRGTLLTAGCLALTLLGGTVLAYPLDQVSLEKADGQAVLNIQAGRDNLAHEVFCLEDPYRVVVDLFGVDQALSPLGAPEAAGGLVRDVRASLWTDSPQGRVVRYVLELDGPSDYSVDSGPGFLRVTVRSARDGLGPNQDPYLKLQQDPAPALGDVDPGAVPVSGRTEPISLDVQNADLRSVLRTISEFAGVNIVADRDIAGPISVKLEETPWRRALDIVCQAAGLIAVDGEGYIRVATTRTWQEEGIEAESAARKREDLQPLISRIFPVRYASADELKQSVVFALSKRGSAEIDGRTNSLLVYDSEQRLAEIERLVAELDTETKQVEIVARLVDVDQTAARQLGIDWSLENLHSTSEGVSGSVGMTESIAGASLTTRIGLVRDFGNLDATIQALERSNEAKLISNPKITTTNNRTAKILVGKEVPLIVLDEAGNPTTELKRVGIALEVTPYINSDNRITMDLRPEVSDLSSQATVQGGLIFTTTLADTRVMVNNGETAVIGGLIRSSEIQFEQGIPILRSIPFLGGLFRQTDKRTESRELLIFVSPRVVDPGMAQAR